MLRKRRVLSRRERVLMMTRRLQKKTKTLTMRLMNKEPREKGSDSML